MEKRCGDSDVAKTLFLTSASADSTQRVASHLGCVAREGDVVGLIGAIGAGKTTFTQGLARGLAVDDAYRVCSPTFTLINEYPGRVPLVHMDFYRLGAIDEVLDLGVEEYLGGSYVCAVEWFELFGSLYADYVRVEMRADQGENDLALGRRILISACGDRSARLLNAWSRRLASDGDLLSDITTSETV